MRYNGSVFGQELEKLSVVIISVTTFFILFIILNIYLLIFIPSYFFRLELSLKLLK